MPINNFNFESYPQAKRPIVSLNWKLL